MAAYIARIFGSAMQFGVEPINPDIIRGALNYCVKNQDPDGSFNEIAYSKTPSSPAETSDSRRIRFTGFVLISLLKNKDFVQNPYTEAIEKGFEYIENRFNYDNYAAAVAAYASALANRTTQLNNYLYALETRCETDGDVKYWNINKTVTTTCADTQVLISAYTAMAYIEKGAIENAKPIIRWLMMQRNPQGGFGDSHSTAVAFEALSMMAEKTGVDNTNIHFELLNDASEKREYTLNNTNAKKAHIIPMPKSTLNVIINGEGSGYGLVSTYYEYYKIINQTSLTFGLYVNTKMESKDLARIEACVTRNIANELSDMVIMEFNLVSGYVYVADKSKPMSQFKSIGVSNQNYVHSP